MSFWEKINKFIKDTKDIYVEELSLKELLQKSLKDKKLTPKEFDKINSKFISEKKAIKLESLKDKIELLESSELIKWEDLKQKLINNFTTELEKFNSEEKTIIKQIIKKWEIEKEDDLKLLENFEEHFDLEEITNILKGYSWNKIDRKGKDKEYIENMQKVLQHFGENLEINWIYDENTITSLTKFQQKYNLTIDWIPGPQTTKALINYLDNISNWNNNNDINTTNYELIKKVNKLWNNELKELFKNHSSSLIQSITSKISSKNQQTTQWFDDIKNEISNLTEKDIVKILLEDKDYMPNGRYAFNIYDKDIIDETKKQNILSKNDFESIFKLFNQNELNKMWFENRGYWTSTVKNYNETIINEVPYKTNWNYVANVQYMNVWSTSFDHTRIENWIKKYYLFCPVSAKLRFIK